MSTVLHKIHRLTSFLRAKIELLHDQGLSAYKIAKIIGFNRSSISRELHRYKNPALYKAELAQIRADKLKANSRKPSKASSPEIMQSIERLIKRPDKPSPEIIAHTIGNITHATIYTIIRTMRPEWKKYLAYQRKHRYRKGLGKTLIPDRVDISLRPGNVSMGDFEADTVVSARGGKSCLGVFVNKQTRLYKVVKMADKTANEMTRAAAKALYGLRIDSITYDNGTENAMHGIINRMLGCESYFCRAYHSWEKGQIENRNKMLRRWLPKGTQFDLTSQEELDRITNIINERPMKCLGWQSPKQAFHNANPLQSVL